VLQDIKTNSFVQIQTVHPLPPAQTKTRGLNVADFNSENETQPAKIAADYCAENYIQLSRRQTRLELAIRVITLDSLCQCVGTPRKYYG
jgi:hypothetical protein